MKEAQLVARVAVEFKKEIELSQDKTGSDRGENSQMAMITRWQV